MAKGTAGWRRTWDENHVGMCFVDIQQYSTGRSKMPVIHHFNIYLLIFLHFIYAILPYWYVVEKLLVAPLISFFILQGIWIARAPYSLPPPLDGMTSSNLALGPPGPPPWHRSSPWYSLAWHRGWGDNQCSGRDCLECSLVNPLQWHVETKNQSFSTILQKSARSVALM